MTNWQETLEQELAHWQAAGAVATFWWRDDDAQSPSAQLDELLDLTGQYSIPLALAVIPKGMQTTLVQQIKLLPTVAVLQHGFCHANHAPQDEKKAELGMHRALSAIHSELASGFVTLQRAFSAQFSAVLVPPWNRIAEPLRESLTPHGFVGLSVFGPREVRQLSAQMGFVNSHVDLIAWRQQKQFIGATLTVQAIVAHLRGRRLGTFDRDEPTGLLTHHLLHHSDCWHFLRQLAALLAPHPAAQWQSATEAFASARG